MFSLLFLPAAEMQFLAAALLAPSTLTLVTIRHGGSPRPVRPALDPLAAPQHIARVTLQFHLVPKGVFGFPGADLSPVVDSRVGTLHLWGTPASERASMVWVRRGEPETFAQPCFPVVVAC